MLNILTSLLFCISFNLDNIAIGIAYGIKKIKLGFFSNLLIAFITTIGTFLSMCISKQILNFIPLNVASIIGALIIILLGLYFLIQSIIDLYGNENLKLLTIKNSKNMIEYASKTDKDKSNYIDRKEAISVALGLSFNNIGMGIIASATGINLFLATFFTFIFSITFLSFGIYIGNKFIGKILGKFAPLISGILLIILGIIEILF